MDPMLLLGLRENTERISRSYSACRIFADAVEISDAERERESLIARESRSAIPSSFWFSLPCRRQVAGEPAMA